MATADALNNISPGELRKFTPFSRLSPEQLILLAHEIVIQQLPAGQTLIALGSTDVDDYFLVQGDVNMTGRTGQHAVLKSSQEEARDTLSRLRPSQYEVSAQTVIDYFSVPHSMIEMLQNEAPRTDDDIGSMTLTLAARRHPIFLDFRHDLKNNNLALPSLPGVASRLRRAVDQAADEDTVASLVYLDPAMAAKLAKVTNSPLYRGLGPVENISQVIERLGLKTTRELIACYSYRDQFKSDSADLNTRFERIWHDAVEIAEIADRLARLTPSVDPDKARLAGLLSDIGTISILHYLDLNSDYLEQEQGSENIIVQLRTDVGSMMLSKWGLDIDFVRCIEHSADWQYNHDGEADYVDVILIARLHSVIGRKGTVKLPRMDTLPAFARIAGGVLDPRSSMELLEGARAAVRQQRQTLSF